MKLIYLTIRVLYCIRFNSWNESANSIKTTKNIRCLNIFNCIAMLKLYNNLLNKALEELDKTINTGCNGIKNMLNSSTVSFKLLKQTFLSWVKIYNKKGQENLYFKNPKISFKEWVATLPFWGFWWKLWWRNLLFFGQFRTKYNWLTYWLILVKVE